MSNQLPGGWRRDGSGFISFSPLSQIGLQACVPTPPALKQMCAMEQAIKKGGRAGSVGDGLYASHQGDPTEAIAPDRDHKGLLTQQVRRRRTASVRSARVRACVSFSRTRRGALKVRCGAMHVTALRPLIRHESSALSMVADVRIASFNLP